MFYIHEDTEIDNLAVENRIAIRRARQLIDYARVVYAGEQQILDSLREMAGGKVSNKVTASSTSARKLSIPNAGRRWAI